MHRSRLALCFALAASSFSPAAGASGVSPGAATAVQREQAQELFVRGKSLFDAGAYTDALVPFRAAMDIVASPNARLYVARCLRETGKLVEAYVEFDRTAVEANEHASEDVRYERTGSSAREERDALASRIGFVQARIEHSTAATKVWVGGEEIRPAGWGEPVPVMPGDTEIVAETPPGGPIRQTVTLTAGDKKAVVIDAVPSAPTPVAAATGDAYGRRRLLRPYEYVAAGVGAAGLLTFAIAGILSDTTFSDLSATCGNKPCPASKQSEVARGQAEQTASDIALGFGLAGLAAGATLFLLSMPPKKEAAPPPVPQPAPPSAPSTEVWLALGWVGVRGSF
jgi:hypothetical protein